MHQYAISGFTVNSDVELPCDPRYATITTRKSVRVQWQSEPFDLQQAAWIAHRPWARAYDVGDGVLISVQDHLQSYISASGETIKLRFDRQDPLCVGMAGANTINLGMAACALLQGHYLPLHAASVEVNGEAVAIMAASGTGKSTLARALLDDGARFCCDDLTMIEVSSSGVFATPSISLHSKLELDAMQRRGLDVSEYQEVFPASGDYWLPIDAKDRVNTPIKLSAIFCLQPTPELSTTGQIFYRRVVGGESLSLLLNNLQGLWIASPYANGMKVASDCLNLATEIPVYILEYHKNIGVIPHLIRMIRDLSCCEKH